MNVWIIGALAILVTGGWICIDLIRTRKRYRKNAVEEAVDPCPPTPYVPTPVSTEDVEADVDLKMRATMVQLREHTTRKVRKRKLSSEAPPPEPPDTAKILEEQGSRHREHDHKSDTQLLRVVVEQAEEVERAAKEKMARR